MLAGIMGQLFAAVLSRWPEGLQPPGLIKGPATGGGASLGPVLLFGKGCCVAGETFLLLGEFGSSFCIWLLMYLLMLCLVSLSTSIRSISASF